jgi:hypothetical protein
VLKGQYDKKCKKGNTNVTNGKKEFCECLDPVTKITKPAALKYSAADPDPASGTFLTPGSGMGKKYISGSGINIPDHISKSLETIFGVKILKFCDADADPGIFLTPDLRSGMGKNRIGDKHPGATTLLTAQLLLKKKGPRDLKTSFLTI